jgi:hypothetical protein
MASPACGETRFPVGGRAGLAVSGDPSKVTGKGKDDMAKDDKSTSTARQAVGGPLPLFYKKPRPLDSRIHGKKQLKRDVNFAFSRETNSVPINSIEFALVQRSYPIVFSGDVTPVPLAVTGLRNSENLFVDEKGQWSPGHYVPAYIRRYPFIFMEGPDGLQFVLCVDEDSKFLTESGGTPLFEADGKPAQLTQNALNFCSAFQGNNVQTREFSEQLKKHNLLVENQANATIAGAEKVSLGGFKIVDEQRFNALPSDVFLEWRAKGWLHLVYSHLMSMANWATLVDLAGRRKSAA